MVCSGTVVYDWYSTGITPKGGGGTLSSAVEIWHCHRTPPLAVLLYLYEHRQRLVGKPLWQAVFTGGDT